LAAAAVDPSVYCTYLNTLVPLVVSVSSLIAHSCSRAVALLDVRVVLNTHADGHIMFAIILVWLKN
jgi:hypothetical protein